MPPLFPGRIHKCPDRLAEEILAGELGFEPRSSVLETDSLTVELTPPVTERTELDTEDLSYLIPDP
jgi:hypothetical protein